MVNKFAEKGYKAIFNHSQAVMLIVSPDADYYARCKRCISSHYKYLLELMSVLGMDGINSYINEAGKKMLGFTTDEEVNTIPISQLHAPEDFDLVQNEVLPTVMSKGQWAGRMRVKHLQTGEVFPVFNNCIRINDPITGEIIGIGAVVRDQRELAAKQASADSEQLLRNITTAAPTGLWMSNDKGCLTYINQTWLYERIVVSGIAEYYHPEDVIGQQVSLLVNLAPREIKGIVSQGMILMAENSESKLTFVAPAAQFENGSVVR